MELFSEIYNCYYRIVSKILSASNKTAISSNSIQQIVNEYGYEETGLFIIPKLVSGEWNLLKKEDNLYISKLNNEITIPLSTLQKSWLKAILLDDKIRLFLSSDKIELLDSFLDNINPLFLPEDIYYYDQFSSNEAYSTPEYIKHFHIITEAIKERQFLKIEYTSTKGTHIIHSYLPLRIEYSCRNDKFRIISLYIHSTNNTNRKKLEILNIDRIQSITPLEHFFNEDFNINDFIRSSYYKEPVTIHIYNKRNGLERAMLLFSNYEKTTTQLDEYTYECKIYYNANVETELLIELLSFGPVIKVLGPDRFLSQFTKRLELQKSLLIPDAK